MARTAADPSISDIKRQLVEIRRELSSGNPLDKPEQLRSVLQRVARRHSDGAVRGTQVEAQMTHLSEEQACPALPQPTHPTDRSVKATLGSEAQEALALPDLVGEQGPEVQRLHTGGNPALEAKFEEMDAELRGGGAAEDAGAVLQGLGPLCSLPSRAGPSLARTGLGSLTSGTQGLGPGGRCCWGPTGRPVEAIPRPVSAPPTMSTGSASVLRPATAPPTVPATVPTAAGGWFQDLLGALSQSGLGGLASRLRSVNAEQTATDQPLESGTADEALARQLQLEADEEAARALLRSSQEATQEDHRSRSPVPNLPTGSGRPSRQGDTAWAPVADAFNSLGGGAAAAAMLARAGIRPSSEGTLPSTSRWRPGASQHASSQRDPAPPRLRVGANAVDADAALAARLQIEADEEAARTVFMAERAARNSGDDSLSLFGDIQDNTPPARRASSAIARGMAGRPSASGMPPRPSPLVANRELGRRPAVMPSRRSARRTNADPEPGNSSDEEREVVLRSAEERTSRFAVPGARAAAVTTATTTVVQTGTTTEACTICCETFQDGETLRLLPCFHKYHAHCVDRWLAQSRTCPVCKHDITS